jgi:hypothetical protein
MDVDDNDCDTELPEGSLLLDKRMSADHVNIEIAKTQQKLAGSK